MTWLSTVWVSDARPTGLGHVGVALATSVVAIVNFVALALIMRNRIKRLKRAEYYFGFYQDRDRIRSDVGRVLLQFSLS
jgi:Na+-driven multidrug efflux pump